MSEVASQDSLPEKSADREIAFTFEAVNNWTQ